MLITPIGVPFWSSFGDSWLATRSPTVSNMARTGYWTPRSHGWCGDCGIRLWDLVPAEALKVRNGTRLSIASEKAASAVPEEKRWSAAQSQRTVLAMTST